MKINYIGNILKLLFVAFTLFACKDDFLDRAPDDQITEDQVFTRYNKVNQLITDLYYNAKMANRPLVYFNHFSSAAVTDECEGSTVEGGITNLFNSGAWSPMGLPSNSSYGQYWWDLYAKIRKANLILEGIRKYNTPDNPLQEGDLNKRIGEVYFLRGYFYYLLIRMYGEVPYIDHVVGVDESLKFKKSSFHEVVDKISQDCDSALVHVPDQWLSTDFGRIDKGACLGLRAIVRWMDATPLWNGGTLPEDTRVFKDQYTYDPNRWVKARDAAKAVLDCQVNGSPRYRLYTGHTNTDFLNDAGVNSSNGKVYARLWDMFYDIQSYMQEGVFFVTLDKNQAWQGDVYPPSMGGASRQMPVQEQVDEYEYIGPDGYGHPIYGSTAKTDGYDDGNPYESVKRDPRFYRDIVYHGSTFRSKVINTASGSDMIGAANSTTTGYFLRKIMKESWNKDKSFSINAPMIWRLPEFIYIYAEAVNEIAGPNQEIYDLVNQVRARSFMAPMPPEVKTDKALMKDYIQRERRVEFFYENNRMWTTRLYLEPNNTAEINKEEAWKNAGTDNDSRSQNYWPYPKCQRMINGMKPVEDPAGKIVIGSKRYRMVRFYVEPRVFVAPRHYLFPIMQDELKRNPELVQNPGW